MKNSKFSLEFLLLIISLTFYNFSSVQECFAQLNETEYGNSLIRVFSDNKAGFIDTTGNVIIQPKFANAYDFSEGLSAARINGTFGFINTKGEFVIKPKYDFVQSFKNGNAVFYRDGCAGILDKSGNELFFENYSLIKFESDTKAFVTTHSKKMGMIDKMGNLIIDTAYTFISGIFGAMVLCDVETFSPSGRIWVGSDVTVFDTTGKIIIPPGIYSGFSDFNNGVLSLSRRDSTGNFYITSFLNKSGNIIFEKNKFINFVSGFDSTINSVLNDSLVIIEYVDLDISGNGINYKGLFNIKSNSLIKDRSWYNMQNLECKSFHVYGDKVNKIITDKGELLFDLTEPNTGVKISENRKYIIMNKNNLWSVYDSEGKIIIPYQEKFIAGIPEYGGNDYVFYLDFTPGGSLTKSVEVKGIQTDFDWVIPKEHLTFDINKSGYVSAADSNNFYCYNPHGKLIFKSRLTGEDAEYNIDHLDKFDFDYHYFYRKSFNPNYNKYNIKDDGVSIFIDEKTDTLYKNKYKGLNFYIVNKGEKPVNLGADYNLRIKAQAKDRDGKWKDIERDESVLICGNGKNDEVLGQYDYIKYAIPVYSGDFKTVMRIVLNYPHPKYKNVKVKIYSNEIECGINPAQFWRKAENFYFENKDFRKVKIY